MRLLISRPPLLQTAHNTLSIATTTSLLARLTTQPRPELIIVNKFLLTGGHILNYELVIFYLGADDYVTKPFSIKELLARAAAFLRRRREGEQDIYEFANYKLDIPSRKLTCKGREIKLSPKEFNLLQLFVKKPGRALTRNEILNRVWGYDCFSGLRSVDRFITTLRNKIEPDPHNPTFIHTIREIGYKFEPPEQHD